jgi:rare lipoprotein A
MSKLFESSFCKSTCLTLCLCIGLSMFITGCVTTDIQDSAPKQKLNENNIRPVTPQREPMSKWGNPDTYKVMGITYQTMKYAQGFVEEGVASWYGTKFHGRRTSSGEVFDMFQISAAHKFLPLPVYVKVTNLENGQSLIAKINDRGPFHDDRIIDLSYAAAVKLGYANKGIAKVRIEVLDEGVPFPRDQLSTKNKVEPKLLVQVGAFSQRQTAEKHAAMLRRRYPQISVSIKPTQINNQPLYRVRIGPFTTEQKAQKFVERLHRETLFKFAKVVFKN